MGNWYISLPLHFSRCFWCTNFVQKRNSIGFHLAFHPIITSMPQIREPEWKWILSLVGYISLNLLLLPDHYKNADQHDTLWYKDQGLCGLYVTETQMTMKAKWKEIVLMLSNYWTKERKHSPIHSSIDWLQHRDTVTE